MHTLGLIIIAGPTATGKSSLAIALSQRLNSVILNADSRACYRGFDIGTAKPTLQEQQAIPHYLLDIADPTENLTVAAYQTQANQMIDHLHQGGITPLLVGGTGLYIKSITHGLLIPRVPPQLSLRSQLAALGQPQLYAFLQQVDPASCERIHAHDQVRTLRALEVYYTTGKPLSVQQGECPPCYPLIWIGLDCVDFHRLCDRIQQRTRQMFKLGFVEEVIRLQDTYGQDLPLLKTLGYQEIGQYLQDKISLAAAEELTVLHTRQFAKRQRTWFRGIPAIHWFDADDPELLETVLNQLNSHFQ